MLAKPDVIMTDIRVRGIAVAGSEAAGRKSPDNHAQTARNLRRSLRNAAAGARLIQAEGLDSKSAAEVAASLADALEELHRLQRNLDRRARRDQGRHAPPNSLDSVGVTRQTPKCSQGCPVSNVSSSTVLKALGP